MARREAVAGTARKEPKPETLVKIPFFLQPSQVEALKLEAKRRAEKKGPLERPNVSELVRTILDGWLSRRRG